MQNPGYAPNCVCVFVCLCAMLHMAHFQGGRCIELLVGVSCRKFYVICLVLVTQSFAVLQICS